MLIHRDGRFSFGHVSFRLPDGVYVDTGDDLVCGQGFSLHTPNDELWIKISGVGKYTDAYIFLAELFDEEGTFKINGKIEPCTVNGLKGYRVSYSDEKYCHEEYAFSLIACGDCTIMNIYIRMYRHNRRSCEMVKKKILTEIFDGIQIHL